LTNHTYPGYRPEKWADPEGLIVRHRHGAPKEAIARMREQEALLELEDPLPPEDEVPNA
jgi:hypothetical protein